MKPTKSIFIAFMLNLCFAVFEFIGGAVTGSVAIMSDALHDMGDATGIGISYLLERKSSLPPDEAHPLGYARYSVLGSAFLNLVLLLGSASVIYKAVLRIINPFTVHHGGMIIFAVLGVIINSLAALFTHRGKSLNQKAVSLHMLEDVLGWIVVLAGAIAIKFTNLAIIDPLMSIGTAIFIMIHSVGNLREATDIFLEKAPSDINLRELSEKLLTVPEIKEIRRIQIWTTDGKVHCAALHIATSEDSTGAKQKIRKLLSDYGIRNITVETDII